MNKKKEISEVLCQLSERIGVLQTLYSVFGNNVVVSIPFDKLSLDTPIIDLDFSVRAFNCLRRAGRITVGDVVEVINSRELVHYRNLGRKTAGEIKTKLLSYAYAKLNNEEKMRFWYDVLAKNDLPDTVKI
jgi:DNA-directed RNA polymerase alpha subunit